MARNEDEFYQDLKNIFIGAKVEGNSGYINLMRIKSAYLEKILKLLKSDIEKETTEFPEFREELFTRLHTFFRTYFSESGSIYFSYTPLKSKVFEKIYSNNQDVILFWKTNMLYYVKTDNLWKGISVDFQIGDFAYKIKFDTSAIEGRSSNEKRFVIFKLDKVQDGVISFKPEYSTNGKVTKSTDILNELKKNNVFLSEEMLDEIFNVFRKQTEVDFFINKDANGFLREQFNIWLRDYLFDDESNYSEKRLNQIKILRSIAFKVIEFVSQFEDELVRIWSKPKFALNSSYVITLDRIVTEDKSIRIIREILEHPNFQSQLKEWRNLGIVDGKFSANKIILKEGDSQEYLNDNYRTLPIDTKYFKDIEHKIIGLFDNLDKELDGWLVHSENFQALSTLVPKFKNMVKVIYIDPPYNTDSSPINYLNNYKDSTFLTLVKNRADISRQFLGEDGLSVTSIDDVELRYITTILDQTFGRENYITTITVECNPQGRVANKVSQTSEYHIIHASDINRIQKLYVERLEERSPSPLKRTGTNSRREERPNRYYPILIKDGIISMINREEYLNIYDRENNAFDDNYVEYLRSRYEKEGYIFVLPLSDDGEKLVWQRTYERVTREKDSYIVRNNNIYTPAFAKEIPKTLWKNPIFSNPEYGSEYLTNMFGEHVFDTPKSYNTLMQLISMGTPGICLDYFAGSGTTAQAIIELNKKSGDDEKRKYLLIENGDWFYSVIIPRIKKLCVSNKWKDGKPVNSDGTSQFFKYFELEQYEQALRNAHYSDSEPFFHSNNDKIYNQYVFMKDKKMLDKMELDYKRNKIRIRFDEIYPNVDLAETLSNLKGKFIKRIEKDAVVFEDDEKICFSEIDFQTIKPLIWW
ncbi:MAG: DNA methyltransferase [Thermoplasmataceae archaeon]|jgi:adenine-specific DNA-methyltransferase